MTNADTRWWLRKVINTPLRDLVRGRATARCDWYWVIESAELPDEVAKVLRKLVYKTHLSAFECVDVADRLVRQVQAGLLEGQSAEQALEPLLPWRKVARQTYREFWRRRPWFGKLPRFVAWGINACFVIYFAFGLYLTLQSPNRKIDYAAIINEQARAVPESDRAWPAIRSAVIEMGLNDYEKYDSEGEIVAGYDFQSGPAGQHWPVVVAFLERHDASLAELRRAAMMPGLGYIADYHIDPADLELFNPARDPADLEREIAAFQEAFADQPPLVSRLLPGHLGTLRLAGQLLLADASRAAEAGDGPRAYANVVAAFALAEYADEHGLLMSQLVKLSIYSAARPTLSRILEEQPGLFTDAQLLGLSERFAAFQNEPIDYAMQQAELNDLIQFVYTDNGSGNGHFDPFAYLEYFNAMDFERNEPKAGLPEPVGWLVRNGVSIAVSPAIALFTADRDEVSSMLDRVFAMYEAEQEVPMWEQPRSRGDDAIDTLFDGSTLNQMRYMPVSVLLHGFGETRAAKARCNAYVDGVRAGIALERYRRAHGGYPDTLAALVPDFLKAVPLDPMNGEPMQYRIIDGQPLLYSIGEDRDDDGGRWPRDEDATIDRSEHDWELDSDSPARDGDWILWPRHFDDDDASLGRD